MDKDILFVIFLIIVIFLFILYINPNPKQNIDNFTQELNWEDQSAFDKSINSTNGDEIHGEPFHDEKQSNLQVPQKKAQVIVFLSTHCPHCVNYDKKHFLRLKGKLEKISNGNIQVKKIYSDNDPKKLFDKYDIPYVPAGVVLTNGKTKKINGEISPNNAVLTIHSLS
jgi:hypothetical protein